MTWPARSPRRTELPADWPEIRTRILQRDSHRCTWIDNNKRCPQPATDVDHGDNGPDDHTDGNLRSLCAWHHRRRTAMQGVAARQPPVTQRRPRERHPGIR